MSEKNGSPPKPPPGFDNFDQLMRKLVKVPKAELDAEVKKGRLARSRGCLVDLFGADEVADRKRGNDEREPAEERDLAVLRAPAAHPGGDVAGL